MSDATPHRIGGSPAYIGDCYLWAEIYYLDSPTDYREFLPGKRVPDDTAGQNLVLLDDFAPSGATGRGHIGLWLFLPVVILALCSWYIQ